MTLQEAKEIAKLEMEKAPVVVVTSDKATYLLQNEGEIEVIKNHANLIIQQLFLLLHFIISQVFIIGH